MTASIESAMKMFRWEQGAQEQLRYLRFGQETTLATLFRKSAREWHITLNADWFPHNSRQAFGMSQQDAESYVTKVVSLRFLELSSAITIAYESEWEE